MMQSEMNRFLETEPADLREEKADLKAGLRRIELTVTKMQEKAPTMEARVPLSSLCTSACFSSVSSVMTHLTFSSETQENERNLQEMIRLHDKALDVMGQEALVDAAIA